MDREQAPAYRSQLHAPLDPFRPLWNLPLSHPTELAPVQTAEAA